MSCTICHDEQVLPYGKEKNGFNFVKCHNCGYIVASPLPTQTELDALYAQDHFESSYHPEQAKNSELLAQREVQYDQDRAMLLEFASKGRMLDFGCGNGHFLGGFPDSFQRMGYEFNRTTTEYLREHANFEVLDTLDNVKALEDGSLDAITMRGVIEHLIEPEAILELLASKLSVGGVFFMCATPNVDSPGSLVYAMDWNQFTPPFHLHYFSPRTISLMAARFGLALIEWRMPYLGTPYENENADGLRFVRDAKAGSDGAAVATKVQSPPYPGTMMSLVLRKVE